MSKFTIFESFWFWVQQLHLSSQEIFQKSQIFLQPSSCEIPQSILCWCQNTESRKIWKLHRICEIIYNIRQICIDFAKVAYFPWGFDFSRAEIFLIGLRFFVKEKCLRSRRAACDCGRKSKIENTNWKSKNLSINALNESFSAFLWRDLQ